MNPTDSRQRLRAQALQAQAGTHADVLAAIMALRALGQSYDAIAVALNRQGLAGPQGGRWFGGTIRRLALQHPACLESA